MTASISSTVLAWLLTYALHSTALLGLTWLLVKLRSWTPSATELLWKAAMLGGIVTASAQAWLDVRPTGTFTLGAPVASASVVEPSANSRREESATRTSEIATPGSEIASAEIAPAELAPVARVSMPRESLAVAIWGALALVLGLSYVARRLILVGRLGDRMAVSDDSMTSMLSKLAREAGLRRTPLLTTTSRISSPIALGVREICVPETALVELDVEQQRSMLAHELAHLSRHDPFWLVLASLVERVLWFQPLNRVASRQIATSAEYICDDWAVRRTGSGVPLAKCLAQVAEWIQSSPLGVPVAGMAEERSLLVSRVARLLAGAAPSTSRRGLALVTAGVLIGMIIVAPGVSNSSGKVLLADTTSPAQESPAPDDPTDTEEQPSSSPSVSSSVTEETSDHREPTPKAKTDTTIVLALIARLRDDDAGVRSAAAQSLGKLEDSRAVPALIATLKDANAEVRSSAAEALGGFQDARAIAPLSALLSDASVDVRRHSLDALSDYEDNVIPVDVVIRLLGDADADVRHEAAHLAGKLRDRSVISPLVKLIRDPSPDVRQAAILALGDIRDPSVASDILPALSDPSPDVRQQALNSIEKLRTPLAETTLIALMKDPDPSVRQKAAHLAGERSVVGAIPALRRMLDDPKGDVRESAVEALSNIADSAAQDALRSALTSKDAKVRRAATEALGDRRP